MLMGYIPTTRLECITNKAGRHRALSNLFHTCMKKILSPLEAYGEISIAMATGDSICYKHRPLGKHFKRHVTVGITPATS